MKLAITCKEYTEELKARLYTLLAAHETQLKMIYQKVMEETDFDSEDHRMMLEEIKVLEEKSASIKEIIEKIEKKIYPLYGENEEKTGMFLTDIMIIIKTIIGKLLHVPDKCIAEINVEKEMQMFVRSMFPDTNTEDIFVNENSIYEKNIKSFYKEIKSNIDTAGTLTTFAFRQQTRWLITSIADICDQIAIDEQSKLDAQKSVHDEYAQRNMARATDEAIKGGSSQRKHDNYRKRHSKRFVSKK